MFLCICLCMYTLHVTVQSLKGLLCVLHLQGFQVWVGGRVLVRIVLKKSTSLRLDRYRPHYSPQAVWKSVFVYIQKGRNKKYISIRRVDQELSQLLCPHKDFALCAPYSLLEMYRIKTWTNSSTQYSAMALHFKELCDG